MFNRAKGVIKDACILFCDEKKLLYTETDASGVGLGAVLLKTNNTSCPRDETPDNNISDPLHCQQKPDQSRKKRNSSIEKESLGILYGLEKFHHYCSTSSDNDNPLVIIFKTYVATL